MLHWVFVSVVLGSAFEEHSNYATLEEALADIRESAKVDSLLAEVSESEKSQIPVESGWTISEEAKTAEILLERFNQILNEKLIREYLNPLISPKLGRPLTLHQVLAGQAYFTLRAEVLANLGASILALLPKLKYHGPHSERDEDESRIIFKTDLRNVVAEHKEFYRKIRAVSGMHRFILDKELTPEEAEKIKKQLGDFDRIAKEARQLLKQKLGYPTIKDQMTSEGV